MESYLYITGQITANHEKKFAVALNSRKRYFTLSSIRVPPVVISQRTHEIIVERNSLGLIIIKSFQCNTRIVMAQRKHLDDFLRGRTIGRLECGRTQLEVSEELLESPRVSSPGFGNDSKMMVIIRPVSSALFSYRYDSFKADRVQTLRAHWSDMFVGLSDVFHLPQLTVACD
ncbi:uncharacterized protein TNCV_4099221 [Trichonephila clavipes]|nr:uncharacterized protein TNCV_4099221 [Trichonephila clavipes]